MTHYPPEPPIATYSPGYGLRSDEAIRQALLDLRRPFTPAAIRFKIQAGGGTGDAKKSAVVVCFIDARLVIERLNHVCLLDWHDEYVPTGNALECRLTVMGVTRRDVGLAGSGPDGGTAKAIYSDALKRSAVHFGVGTPVYAAPTQWVEPDGIRYGGKDNRAVGLTPQGEARCRAAYASWLANHGIAAFGEALDHGDVEDSAGDTELADQREPGRPPTATPVAPTPRPQAPPVAKGPEAEPPPPLDAGGPDDTNDGSAASFQAHIDKIAPPPVESKLITAAQRNKLFAEARKHNITEDELHVIAKLVGHVDSIPQLPRSAMDQMYAKIPDFAACTPERRFELAEMAARQVPTP